MADLKIWNTITLQAIAKAMATASQGNLNIFSEKLFKSANVWSQLCQDLKLNSSQQNYHWLRVVYVQNRVEILELCASVCRSNNWKTRSKSIISRGTEYCLCRYRESKTPSLNMIQCEKCQQWFHNVCVGLSSQDSETLEWNCPPCSEQLVSEVMPSLLLKDKPKRKSTLTSTVNEEAPSTDPNEALNQADASTGPRSTEGIIQDHLATDFCEALIDDTGENSNNNGTSGNTNSLLEHEIQPTNLGNSVPDAGQDTLYGARSDCLTAFEREADDNIPVPLSHFLLEMNQPDEADRYVKKTGINTTFQFKLTCTQWNEIKPERNTKSVADKRYEFQLKRNVWTHRFTEAFMKNVPSTMSEFKGCVLRFKGHKISESSGTFLKANATCSAQKENCCKMKYNFTIQKKPKSEKDVLVCVRAEGDLLHDLSLSRRRNLAGVARSEVKDNLLEISASKLHHRIFSDSSTDQHQIRQGNDTQVQTTTVLKKARSEALATLDLDKDAFVDLIKRRQAFLDSEEFKSTLPGFIQELSQTPFFMNLYTERQFKILQKLMKLNKFHCLFLDSTGSISAGLGDAYPTKRQFYYALTTLFPGPDEVAAIPLLEVISGCHKAYTIASFLHYFFAKYGEYTGSKITGFGIRRMTTDFSKALISGVLQALEFGTTLQYIKEAWECLAFSRQIRYVHHVCKWHLKDAIGKHITSLYRERPNSLLLMERLVSLLLKCSDLWDVSRRMNEFIVIVGKPYQEDFIDQIIEKLDTPTDRSGNLPFPLYAHEITENSEETFYAQSPFGNFAIRRCHILQIPNLTNFYKNAGFKGVPESNNSTANPNPHFSLEFLKYLLEHIFPYQCLLDNSLITLNGLPITDLTNATAESWNSVLKERECKWNLPDKAGRVVKKLKDCTEGRVIKFEHFLSRYELQKRNRSTYLLDIDHEDSTTSLEKSCPSSISEKPKQPNNDQCYPDRSNENWGPKKKRVPKLAKEVTEVEHLKVVPQEGSICMGKQRFALYNKCWADVSLQALHVIMKTDRESNCYFKNLAEMGILNMAELMQALAQVDLGNFDAAFETLFKKILNYSFAITSGDNFIDVEDSQERFFASIKYAFSFGQEYLCKNEGCNVKKTSTVYPLVDSSIFLSNDSYDLKTMYNSTKKLDKCEGTCSDKSQPIVQFKWGSLGTPPVFCISLPQQADWFLEKDLPDSISVLGIPYKIYIYTVYSRNHFYNVLLLKGRRYVFDGLYPGGYQEVTSAPEGHRISCIWLLRNAAA